MLMGAGHGATHWIIATVYVVLPFLAQDFGLTFAAAGSLITIFHAASLSANAGSGAIVDVSGRYVVCAVWALVIGAAGLSLFVLAGSFTALIVPIIIIGLTNNLWHPAAIAFLSRRYPGQRGFALSIHTLGATMGDVLAPLCAGALLVVLSWQTTSLVMALPVLGVAALIRLRLRTADHEERASRAATSSQDGREPYLKSLSGLAGDRNIVLICLMSGFRSMTQNGLLVFLPLYLVNVLKAGPVLLGIAMTGIQIGAVIAGPVAGILSDRIGRRPVVLTGLLGTAATVAALSQVTGMVPFIGLSLLLGFVMFSIRSVIHSWTMDLAPESMSGSAVSLLFASQSAFTMLVPIVGGLLADSYGLVSVFYALTATMLISTVFALALPKGNG